MCESYPWQCSTRDLWLVNLGGPFEPNTRPPACPHNHHGVGTGNVLAGRRVIARLAEAADVSGSPVDLGVAGRLHRRPVTVNDGRVSQTHPDPLRAV